MCNLIDYIFKVIVISLITFENPCNADSNLIKGFKQVIVISLISFECNWPYLRLQHIFSRKYTLLGVFFSVSKLSRAEVTTTTVSLGSKTSVLLCDDVRYKSSPFYMVGSDILWVKLWIKENEVSYLHILWSLELGQATEITENCRTICLVLFKLVFSGFQFNSNLCNRISILWKMLW